MVGSDDFLLPLKPGVVVNDSFLLFYIRIFDRKTLWRTESQSGILCILTVKFLSLFRAFYLFFIVVTFGLTCADVEKFRLSFNASVFVSPPVIIFVAVASVKCFVYRNTVSCRVFEIFARILLTRIFIFGYIFIFILFFIVFYRFFICHILVNRIFIRQNTGIVFGFFRVPARNNEKCQN